jgi:hypothetical protein
VSYALTIAGDALADLRALEPWLQEEVLDELELLADDPLLAETLPPGIDSIYSFIRTTANGARHHVVVTLFRSAVHSTISLLGIANRIVGPRS